MIRHVILFEGPPDVAGFASEDAGSSGFRADVHGPSSGPPTWRLEAEGLVDVFDDTSVADSVGRARSLGWDYGAYDGWGVDLRRDRLDP